MQAQMSKEQGKQLEISVGDIIEFEMKQTSNPNGICCEADIFIKFGDVDEIVSGFMVIKNPVIKDLENVEDKAKVSN